MSKPFLRLVGAGMALLGAAILAFALYAYISQKQLEAQLEAQIPGQTSAAPTTTPVVLIPALEGASQALATGVPTLDVARVSPSITPVPKHATPVQPDATTAANLLRTPTSLPRPQTTPTPTERDVLSNIVNRPTAEPTPTLILAGIAVPTPASGAPTLVAQESKPQGIPRGSGTPASRLRIPKLNMNLEVKPADYVTFQLNGQLVSDWNIPYDAAGHLITTAQPGEIGNAVMSGHHNLSAPNTFGLGTFAGLWNLAVGDEVQVTTQDGKTQLWRVTDSFPVKEGGEPLAVRIQHAQEIMGDTPVPTLTLLTCWNGKTNPLSGNTYRWVVHAELVGIN